MRLVLLSHELAYMGRNTRKPVFGVSEEVRFKPACSATETSQNIEILLVASLDILSKEQITMCRLIWALVVHKPWTCRGHLYCFMWASKWDFGTYHTSEHWSFRRVTAFVFLFDSILYILVNNFSCRDGPSWVEPVLSKDKCVLLKDATQWRQWGLHRRSLWL